MATNTTNYGWTKPSYEDAADIEVINGTIDNIDAQVKTVETAIPTTLAELSGDSTHRTVTDTEKATWNAKADVADIPTVPITAIQKNGIGVTPVSGTVNIIVPTTAADVSALPDTTKYATALSLTINSSTFVMTGQLKDQNGDNLGTAQTIDLPLESVVVGGSYNSQTKKVVLTLQNGNTIEFSVADLVSGLQTEFSASNKLNPAYINYDSTHRAVSDTEKSTWNGKQNALSSAQLAAVNSGIDSAKVEQIETNKNNILTLESMNGAKNCAKGYISAVKEANSTYSNWNDNVLSLNGATFTFNSDYTVTINGTTTDITILLIRCDVVSGVQYHMSGCPLNGSNDSYLGRITNLAGTTLYSAYDYGTGNNFTSDTTTIYYQIRIANGYAANNIVFKPMIITKAAYDAGYTDYQPYAMTNAEITAWILSQS